MNSKISTFILSNGLSVVYDERPGSLNTSISLRVIAGSIYESSDEIGVAHFLEHIVFDGTLNYPSSKELAELIDERGGMRNASTNKETIEYVVKVLKEDSEIAFSYISEIVSRPLIKEESVEKQKKIIEQEIYRFKSDPEKLASRMIYSALFPSTSMARFTTGEVVDVQKISRSKILSYLDKTHRAGNMILSVCGDISESRLKDLANQYFGEIKSGEKIMSIDLHVEPKSELTSSTIRESEQSILMVGYQSPKRSDRGYYATGLLLAHLARGKSSRLLYEIREKRALAYMVNGNYWHGRNAGIFTIQVGLAKENIDECVEIIKSELAEVTSRPLTKEELDKAFTLVKSNLAFSFENSLSTASYYSNLWCATGEIRSVDQELSDYEEVSKDPEFIKNVATSVFSRRSAIILVG